MTGFSSRRAVWRRAALAGSLVALGVAGCDHFRVESFHGSKLLLDVSGARPTAAGHHVELWARESTSPDDQRIDRLLASAGDRHPDGTACQPGESCPPAAYVITPAIPFSGSGATFQLTDGCMIDDGGHLLWSPDADPDGQGAQGQAGAAAVLRRIHQITDGDSAPLLVLASWDDASDARPPVDEKMAPAERLAACRAFWAQAPFAYDGNPFQITAPRHGVMYGALDYQTTSPPQLLGGIAITSDYSLHDLVELWLTDTAAPVGKLDPAQVDCGSAPDTCRGHVLLDGTLAPQAGAGVFHLELHSPDPGGPTGSAAVEVRLDEDPRPL